MCSLNPRLSYGVHSNTSHNAVTALLVRSFFIDKGGDLLLPIKASVTKDAIRSLLWPIVSEVRCQDFQKWTLEQFVESYKDKNVQYKRYLKIMEIIEEGKWTKAKFKKTAAFLKDEKTNFSLKMYAAARIIQSADYIYHMILGCWIKPLDEYIFKAIDTVERSPATIAKGYNALELAENLFTKWKQFEHPIVLSIDSTKFDANVGGNNKFAEEFLYSAAADSLELKRLLKYQRKITGRFRLKDRDVFYKLPQGRRSGDMNTGGGNSIISYAKTKYLIQHCKITKYAMAINGDDVLLFVERDDHMKIVKNIDTTEKLWGFYTEIDSIATSFEQIEFCQMHPIQYQPDKYVMARNILAVLQKDTTTIKNYNTDDQRRAYMKAIADSGLAMAGGLPFYTQYYTAINRGSEGKRKQNITIERNGMYYMARGMNLKEMDVDYDLALLSISSAFNISTFQIHRLESLFDQMVMTCKTVIPQSYNQYFADLYGCGQTNLSPVVKLNRYKFAAYNLEQGCWDI